MRVGSLDIADYVNTSTGKAINVVAVRDIGGATVSNSFKNLSDFYLTTETPDRLLTEGGDLLVAYSYVA